MLRERDACDRGIDPCPVARTVAEGAESGGAAQRPGIASRLK